jgi:hypothetical protein
VKFPVRITAVVAAIAAFIFMATASAAASSPTKTPSKQISVILMGSNQQGTTSEAALEAEYALWSSNRHVNAVFRSLSPNPNDPTMLSWEQNGYHYVWTAASSDYATSGLPLYVCTSNQPTCKNTIGSVLARPHNVGLYMHEVVSDAAAGNGWNWTAAAQAIDWATIDLYVAEAHRYNKVVIWSEPALGWKVLGSNPNFIALAKQQSRWLVPMYATNFSLADIKVASSAAAKVARTYGMHLGESVQSWYFRDRNLIPTPTATTALAHQGLALGATYFQVEGAPPDMQTDPLSAYMQGVNTFVAKLPS